MDSLYVCKVYTQLLNDCYVQLTFPSFPLAFCSAGCFVVEEEEEGGGSLISVPTSG